MAIVTSLSEIKPDVYDVLMGGDESWDPAETPLFNRLTKGPDTPNAALFQFPYDAPDTPDVTGSAEGGDYTQAATTQKGNADVLYGRMHHKKTYFGVGEVTNGNESYAYAGKDPFMYQMRRHLRYLLNSAETIIVGAQESQAGSGSDAFRTRGLEVWINDTAGIAAQTDTATVVPATFRPAAAQVKTVTVSSDDYAFAETDLAAMANAMWNARKARIDIDGWCTTKLKGKISDWGNLQPNVSNYTLLRRFNHDAESKKIIAVVDVWQGDAGKISLALHPRLRQDTATQLAEGLFLDYRWVQLRFRTAPSAKKLDPQGGGERGVAMMTWGVQCVPKYLGKVRRDA